MVEVIIYGVNLTVVVVIISGGELGVGWGDKGGRMGIKKMGLPLLIFEIYIWVR